ncbi:hypothetical protein [Sphingobacterium sp. JB170]|uniref:hypothetical protein n=1 Tax=Sphingobacterium sp. JB170 TaxID=1434842 RepID=UPI000B35FB9D|nr:hypothetical protein [Sphingobacterium sp. JB170]
MIHLLKHVKISLTAWSVTLEGNWGNPALGGGDYGTIYFNIVNGTQGETSGAGRQLKFDSYNNSFISPASGSFTLQYSDDTAFDDVTSSTPSTAAPYALGRKGTGTGANPIGWYEYTEGGIVSLVEDFVMYVSDGTNTYAFAATGYQANGTATNNQGIYTFEVKQL